jgi:lipoprotein-releasing system permease protein
MSLEWIVARRYLLSRERNALISVNTLISVLGVAVGVAALVVVIGVMDGAYKLLMRQITNIAPHVRLVPDEGTRQALDPGLLAELRERPGVLRVDAVLNKQAFIQLPKGAQAQKQGIQLFGLDRVDAKAPFAFTFARDFKPVDLHGNEIALGRPVAQKLNAPLGAAVQVLILRPGNFPQQFSFRVAAIVDTGYYDFDSRTAFISNAVLQRMFPQPGPDYIAVKLQDPQQAAAFKHSLNLRTYGARTWQEENAEFFAALTIQKYGLFIILSLIVLVSAFNIIGTLILMVKEKTREIGILRAVGAGPGFIGKLFLFIGVLIGMTGTGLGIILGVGIALLVPYAPIKMPESIYNFDRLPMDIEPLTLLSIIGAALVICTLGAIIPAMQAARLNPAQAVRYD